MKKPVKSKNPESGLDAGIRGTGGSIGGNKLLDRAGKKYFPAEMKTYE